MDQLDSEDENKRPGVPVDTGRLLQALRRHWRVIPTAMAIGALLGLGVAALFIKPSYTAKATVLWEPPAEADPSDRSFVTQVDSIKLTSNLKEVKKRLKSKLSIEDMKEKINLLFDGQSHLVQVEATDGSAKGAVALANTVVDVFLDYQRSIGRDRGSEHLKRIDADLVAAQAQFRSAQEVYDAFRKEIGVTNFDVDLKLALQKVADLKSDIEKADLDIATETAREQSMSAEAARQPAVRMSGETLVNPDKQLLAQAESQLAAESAHLSPDHPTVLRLQRQVETLRARIASNPSSMVQSQVSVTQNQEHVLMASGAAQSKVLRAAAQERKENAKRTLPDAERRLQELTNAQPRAEQLMAAIGSQETHKNELEALKVRTLDQVRSTAAGFRVVTPATPPEKPNPSTRRAVVIRVPLAALFLSLLGIVIYELRGLRVHTAREAGFWANAAVIASSTWPREQTTLGSLIDELSDAAPAVRGTTLVVGARVNEVPLAREIAYWLSHLTTGLSHRGVVGADEPVVAADPSMPRAASGSPQAAASGGGTALARRSGEQLTIAQAWDGPAHGPSLRRASRLADRVLVVVAAGTMSMTEISQLRSRLGRSNGIGLLLVGLNPEFVKLPDRVGEVERFWEDRAA